MGFFSNLKNGLKDTSSIQKEEKVVVPQRENRVDDLIERNREFEDRKREIQESRKDKERAQIVEKFNSYMRSVGHYFGNARGSYHDGIMTVDLPLSGDYIGRIGVSSEEKRGSFRLSIEGSVQFVGLNPDEVIAFKQFYDTIRYCYNKPSSVSEVIAYAVKGDGGRKFVVYKVLLIMK